MTRGHHDPFYEGWAEYQRRLLDVIRPLTDEQVKLRPVPEHYAIWQLASNMVGGRVHWFHDVLGEGDPALRQVFRVATMTVPGLPLEDAGWEDDEDHPRAASVLVDAFEKTWSMIYDCLQRWTAEDLRVEFTRERPGRIQRVSRGWVIWHVMEHELQHGTEIALILRGHGLPTLEI